MSNAASPLTLEADEIGALRARIAKLERINAALMDRVERSTDLQGSAFTMFETAISLEAMVRDRTSVIEDAMARLATVNAELADAHAGADAARARLRDAIESLVEGFALFDADDRLILCNDAYLSLWPEVADHLDENLTFGDIARIVADNNRTMGALVAPDRWVSDRLARHSIAEGGHVQALSDGRWIQINELRTSEGGIVGIYTDITDVKAEDARERARELAAKSIVLQATLDAIPQGVCVYDIDHRLVAWNGPLLSIIGLPVDAIASVATHEGLVDMCTRLNGPMDADEPLAWLPNSASETISRRHHSSGRVIEVRRTPMPDGGMVMSFFDITGALRSAAALREANETLERRVEERTAEISAVNGKLQHQIAERMAAEAAMAEAKTVAEEANRSKTRFLAAASHDLLQPLNAARLFTAALTERRLALPTRALINQTSTALDSVEDLLEALLEISRLDAGAIQPEVSHFRLDALLATLRIEFAPMAMSAGLDFRVDNKAYWVESDVRLLRRILQNFVSNAIRYTPRGSVTLSCEAIEQGTIRVSVSDTGTGIAVGEQEQIFEEFKRLDSVKRVPGKGLGLAIVRRASDMLGHPINLTSAPGRGSCFSIDVPLGEERSSITGDERPASGARSMKGRRILVIDNEAQIQKGMQALLSGWGCEIATVATYDEACRQAQQDQPIDLVIADYHLNDGQTGDEAVRLVRAQRGHDIPAIIISADRSDELKVRLDAQEMPLLGKPIKPAQMRALLRTMLS